MNVSPIIYVGSLGIIGSAIKPPTIPFSILSSVSLA
jgi:hypothetical protein